MQFLFEPCNRLVARTLLPADGLGSGTGSAFPCSQKSLEKSRKTRRGKLPCGKQSRGPHSRRPANQEISDNARTTTRYLSIHIARHLGDHLLASRSAPAVTIVDHLSAFVGVYGVRNQRPREYSTMPGGGIFSPVICSIAQPQA